MSDTFKTTYRGYLIDHHSPDPPVVTLSRLDPAECERFFEEANINQLMLYCKDHWGNSYYDTKIGRKHPGLGERDWVAQVVPILRRHNIEFTAYYCFEYDNYAPQAHPEWSVLTKDGIPLRCGMPTNSSNAKWGIPCLHTGYRDYALGQLREIVETYHPDSLFIDIFGMTLCYCPTCREKYRARFGYDMPETEAEMIEKNKDLTDYLDDEAEKMLDDVRKTVKSIDETLAVTVNFSAHYPKQIRDKLDYMFTEPWAGNWLSGAYARDTSGGKFPQLGPGDVSKIFNYQPDSIYELAAAEIAAQGCRVFLYSESMREDGSLEFEEAMRVGKAYREVEKFEAYLTDRTLQADVAIVQSDLADSLLVKEPVQIRCVSRAKVSGRHRQALLGAMKLCDHSKHTWCVVPELELDYKRMCAYKLIILPNVFHIREQLANDLRRYVQQGGKVLFSGECGICDAHGALLSDFALADLMGCQFVEKDESFRKNGWCAYIRQTDSLIWQHSAKTTPPVAEYTLHTLPTTAVGLGTFVDPAVLLTDTTWVNWGNPLPGKQTHWNAIYENHVGSGTVFTTCFDLCSMASDKDFVWTKPFFCDILDAYVDAAVYLETENKNTLEFTCYERGSTLLVHELSAMARLSGGDTPLVPGGKLKIATKYRKVVSAEQVYPEKKSLPITADADGRYVSISLEPVRIHAVYQLVCE